MNFNLQLIQHRGIVTCLFFSFWGIFVLCAIILYFQLWKIKKLKPFIEIFFTAMAWLLALVASYLIVVSLKDFSGDKCLDGIIIKCTYKDACYLWPILLTRQYAYIYAIVTWFIPITVVYVIYDEPVDAIWYVLVAFVIEFLTLVYAGFVGITILPVS